MMHHALVSLWASLPLVGVRGWTRKTLSRVGGHGDIKVAWIAFWHLDWPGHGGPSTCVMAWMNVGEGSVGRCLSVFPLPICNCCVGC